MLDTPRAVPDRSPLVKALHVRQPSPSASGGRRQSAVGSGTCRGAPYHRRYRRAPVACPGLLPSSSFLNAARRPGNSQSAGAGYAVFVDLLALEGSFLVSVSSHNSLSKQIVASKGRRWIRLLISTQLKALISIVKNMRAGL